MASQTRQILLVSYLLPIARSIRVADIRAAWVAAEEEEETMIGLELEDRERPASYGTETPSQSSAPRREESVEDTWDDEDWEDWLFL
jgi:hypothetical protein